MGKQVFRIANVVWGQIAVALITLLAIRIHTELLGHTELGVYMLILGAVALLDGVGVMALNQTLFSRCGSIDDREERRQIAVGLAWRFVRVAAPVTAVLSAAICGLQSYLSAQISWLLLPPLITAYVVSETAKTSLLSLVVLQRRYAVYSAWTSAESMMALAGTTLSLMYWRPDACAAAVGYIVGRVASTLLQTLVYGPAHLRGIDPSLSAREVDPALRYGTPVAIMGPLGWASAYLDRFLIGALLSTADTGSYVAATGLVSRPYGLLTTVLTNYFRPMFFDQVDEEFRSKKRIKILRNWALCSAVIGSMGCIGLATLGGPISEIALAEDYRKQAPVLMVLFACAQTLAITTHAADNAMLAIGESSRLLWTQVALTLVTIVFIPIGVHIGGLVGAVLGRCVAEAVKLTATLAMAAGSVEKVKNPSLLPIEGDSRVAAQV